MVVAMAALRELVWMGMWATWSAPSMTSSGSPSRSDPTIRTMSADFGLSEVEGQSSDRGSPQSGTRAIFTPGSGPSLATGTVKIAPIDALTALGPKGSADPGPRATHEAPNASALLKTAPTFPGSWTPWRYTHNGPTGDGAHRSSYTASVRVPEPIPDACDNS